MPEELLEFIEQQTAEEVDAAVIWLHGLGANGYDFLPIVSQLNLDSNLGIRFIFPHAPMQPVTINGGYTMPAWYDIIAADFHARQDGAGIKRSEQRVIDLINHEIERGIDPRRILLAGFSQGGALAMYTGLRLQKPLAGLMALSAYLPMSDGLVEELSPVNREMPIFLAHGNYDPLVLFDWGKHSYQLLQSLGYPAQWSTYDMEHCVCDEEIADIGEFINQVFSGNTKE